LIAALEAQRDFTGNCLALSSVDTVTRVYTRLADGSTATVLREDSRVIDYDTVALTYPGRAADTLELANQLDSFSNNEQLLDGASAPAVALSANCAANDGSVCLPGTWGGVYRYAPGINIGGVYVYPETSYGDVLSFTAGAPGSVSGLLSNIPATWSVANGSLVIDYGNGWTQTATIMASSGMQYGVFSEYANNGTVAYASHDIWVKRDPSFAFSDSYLQSQPGRYWNGDINSWPPGNVDGAGEPIATARFGWDLDASTDPNTGFNRSNDGTNLYLNPNEWAVEPSGRVKIDRYLDTQLASRDRYWYPLAGTVINGQRQFYVMEIEEGFGGLLFPARLNIEREIDKLPDNSWSSIFTRTPVIVSTAVVNAMQPNPAAAGFGQLVLLSGSNLPGSNVPFSRPDVFVTQGGVTYTGFVLNRSDTDMLVRLPTSGLVPGIADLQVSEAGAGQPKSAAFAITISNTPGKPILLQALSGGTPTTTLIPGATLSLQAIGIDTSGAIAVFEYGGNVVTAASAVTYSAGPTAGITADFQVPALPENTVVNV